MFEIRLPAIRKYQKISSVAAVVGFLLGVLIPSYAFVTGRWSCPFGDGVIRSGGFVLLVAILSAALLGNAAALLLIFIGKLRQSSSHLSRRRKD